MRALLFTIVIGLVAATSANAGLVPFRSTPNYLPYPPQLAVLHSTPNDLSELLHAKYYTTGINSARTPNKITTAKVLMFANIWGWTNKSGGDWSDPISGKPQNLNLVFDFGSLGLLDMYNNFAETIPGTDKANFEFGINPDYNDYDDSVTFTINTETQTPTTYTP
jgi:hypothetical protein